jgi:phytoene/squalene synthetase
VYAFARWGDDLADEAGDDAGAGLADWRFQLEECFAGRPRHPVFVALADTVQRAELTMGPFADLLPSLVADGIPVESATFDPPWPAQLLAEPG